MQSRLSGLWFRIAVVGLRSNVGRFLAKRWHRWVPSFPVKRRVFDLDIFFDSRDHPYVWYGTRNSMEEAENIPGTLGRFKGNFWDVGSNAGTYSLFMAARGNPVVAFDISPKSISYVMKSAAQNGLKNITGVARAFSTEPFRYRMPQTATADNHLCATAEGADATAITYKEAAEQFGVPAVIKMDIEGHEETFLRSAEFKDWLVKNGVALIMELHRQEYWDLLWKDIKWERISQNVVFIQPEKPNKPGN